MSWHDPLAAFDEMRSHDRRHRRVGCEVLVAGHPHYSGRKGVCVDVVSDGFLVRLDAPVPAALEASGGLYRFPFETLVWGNKRNEQRPLREIFPTVDGHRACPQCGRARKP